MTNVIKAHLHSCLDKLLSTLDNGLCLSAKAKFQTNLMAISFMKRKPNVVTIEIKLETVDQIVIGVRGFFSGRAQQYRIVIRLSEKIDYPNHPWSQLVRTIGVLL